MAVKIRLKRMGKTHAPKYRIVVVDSREKRDGEVIEEIGNYRPQEEPSHIHVVSERVQYWLGVGAQPSKTVGGLLRLTGDWQAFKGLPGAEGSLQQPPEAKDKQAIFNEALKEAHLEGRGEAVTGKSDKSQQRQAGKTDEQHDSGTGQVEVKPEEAPAEQVIPDDDKPGAEAAPEDIQTPASDAPGLAAEEAEDDGRVLRSDDEKRDA